MNEYLRDIEAVGVDAARQAAVVLLDYFGRATIHEKQTQNLVTEADFRSQEIVTQVIQRKYPTHQLLREESDAVEPLDAEHLWIIDPLDGTNNYAHGIPQFCVSIAYAQRGIVQVGVVYDPLRDELFTARRGSPATLNGQPIHVSSTTDLSRGIFATGFYYDRGEAMERTLGAIRTLFQRNIRGIRRMGAAALDISWVACGRFQGFFEYRLAPWDWAAAGLIVECAGGECWDRGGGPVHLTSLGILVACPGVGTAFRDAVRWEESAPTGAT